MKLLCWLGRHRWGPLLDGVMLRSKAGILAGTATVGRQECARCGAERRAFEFYSFIAGGPAGAGRKATLLTPDVEEFLAECYVPLNAGRSPAV